MEEHFFKLYSVPNNNLRSNYVNTLPESERLILEDTSPVTVLKEEVQNAIKGIAVDTSPGPDHVLMRVVREDSVSDVLALIATKMLMTTCVPPCLHKARTVLIYKSGDEGIPSNWIPIFSCQENY